MKIIQGEAERRSGIHYEYDPNAPLLGEGGMGKVYRGWCFDEFSGKQREVAIKVLKPECPNHVIMRARREASVRLRNDNLVEMFGFVETKNKDEFGLTFTQFHVISEYLHGVTLASLMNGKVTDYLGNVIPFAQELYGKYMNDPYHFALIIIRSLLSGLMALHDSGYIHRDIDPSNLMVTSDGHIKLIDFGIAKRIRGELTDEGSYTMVGQFIGKPKYAAPELARGLTQELGIPTDLYAVGILLFQLITGHAPFEGEMAEVLDMQINKKIPLAEIKQSELRNIIKKSTCKNKEQRYQSAAEFRVALEKLTSLPYPQKSLDFTKIGITAAAVAIVCGGILWWNNHDVKQVYEDIPSISKIEKRQEGRQTEKPNTNENFEYSNAIALLKEADTAKKGLQILDKLSHSKSEEISHKATFLLSRLHFQTDDKKDLVEIADSIKLMQNALGSSIVFDNEKAHKLLLQANTIKNDCYHTLYELGCDCMSRGKRGTEKNLPAAKEYLTKAKELADAAKDADAIDKINKRLSVIK